MDVRDTRGEYRVEPAPAVDKSDVQPSYKRTEVGIIPEDWKAWKLSEHFTIYAGGDVPEHSLSQTRSEAFPYPIFANSLSDKGLYGYTSERRAKADSLTITGRGYLGHAEYRDQPYFPIVRLLVLEPKGTLDAKFTAYAVNECVDFAFESTGVPQLTAPQVGRYWVAAPSTLREQRAIAEALSDVDELLGALDRLIAKKRDLKQATMQQLLTGQSRLPGFTGGGVSRRLGDVAQIKTGARNNEDQVKDGQYPFFVRSEVIERINSYSYDCEAILVPGEGRIGSIFHYVNGRFDVHQRVYAITDFDPEVFPRFIHAYLALKFGAWAFQNTVKATVDSLRLPTFQKFELLLPPAVEEQTAIAAVLSDMDAEIETLEARRAKTRDLKQAMMQELLTGRTRLV